MAVMLGHANVKWGVHAPKKVLLSKGTGLSGLHAAQST